MMEVHFGEITINMKNLYKVLLILVIFIFSSCQSHEIRRGDTGIEIGETEQVDREKEEEQNIHQNEALQSPQVQSS